MNNREPEKTKRAIALEYNGESVPYVSAVGEGQLADEIREVATQHNIPLKENQALLKHLDSLQLSEGIPDKIYSAVAQNIAFIYHLEEKF